MAVAGGRWPSELRKAGTSSDLNMMLAYWQREPWGSWRDNWHAGQIGALLFNINRGKSQQPLGASDFMYTTKEDQEEQSLKRLIAELDIRASNG